MPDVVKPHFVHTRDPYKLYPHDYVLKYFMLPLIPRFVTPNMITWLRFILTPIVIWFVAREQWNIGVPLFIFTAFTDALDGALARVRRQITDWGTFYDPVADKLLIGIVVLIIVVKYINIYFGLIIILLELLIIGGGWLRRRRGILLPANVYGKVKMFLQVCGVTFLLISVWGGVDLFVDLSVGSFALAIVFAIISLFTYGI